MESPPPATKRPLCSPVRYLIDGLGAIAPGVPVDLFKSLAHNLSMKPNAIRTSIDLPRDLHRRVHEAAARKGCSARKLILAGIERAVEEAKVSRPSRRLSLEQPLIRPAGRRINITNEEAYEVIELP